jgi:hypothetical protein
VGYGVGGATNENVTVNVSLACALELPSTLAVTTVASDIELVRQVIVGVGEVLRQVHHAGVGHVGQRLHQCGVGEVVDHLHHEGGLSLPNAHVPLHGRCFDDGRVPHTAVLSSQVGRRFAKKQGFAVFARPARFFCPKNMLGFFGNPSYKTSSELSS